MRGIIGSAALAAAMLGVHIPNQIAYRPPRSPYRQAVTVTESVVEAPVHVSTTPTNGKREVARRLRQIGRGQLKVAS